MSSCASLIKAIDAYIAKEDENLEDALKTAGFADPGETVRAMSTLEEKIAAALTAETAYIKERAKGANSPEALTEEWAAIQAENDVDWQLEHIFVEDFQENIPIFSASYIRKADPGLTVRTITKRTTDWVAEWSGTLGKLMKQTSHDEIERIFVNTLAGGKSVEDFTRALMDSGIREERYRARRVALTETLRAHSVAQQEAITQNAAVEAKQWIHTGEYRNMPRENHVAIHGQTVPKNDPFTLDGADGVTYFPMYPRDTGLPPGESVNCHCIHQGIASEDVLGLSLEERQRMQQEAIDADDGEWEKELDARNKARAGIEETPVAKPDGKQYNKIYADIQENFKLSLNTAHQNRHIPGTAGYTEGRSILTADAEELLKLYQGHGELKFTAAGKWTNKESFTHTEVIGTYKTVDGVYKAETKNGVIHYSKRNGMHIVPSNPDRR